jgi:hypothetical protein
MKIHIPPFEEDIHYSELAPKDGKYRYRYILTRSLIVFWEGYVPKGTKISFKDKNKREWLFMDDRHFIVPKRYSWDGCTPKMHIPIFGWIGTPDFEKTMLPSLIHDVFCQFQNTEHFPFSRHTIDTIFKQMLDDDEFFLTELYYMGVRIGAKFPFKGEGLYSKLIVNPSDSLK